MKRYIVFCFSHVMLQISVQFNGLTPEVLEACKLRNPCRHATFLPQKSKFIGRFTGEMGDSIPKMGPVTSWVRP